jgi:hypothetical protein
VYDRLYSKSTESSRVRKSVAPVTEKNFLTRSDDKKLSGNSKNPSLKTLPKKAKVTCSKRVCTATLSSSSALGIHDRLYSKGTASYNSKKKGGKSASDSRGPLKSKTNF